MEPTTEEMSLFTNIDKVADWAGIPNPPPAEGATAATSPRNELYKAAGLDRRLLLWARARAQSGRVGHSEAPPSLTEPFPTLEVITSLTQVSR